MTPPDMPSPASFRSRLFRSGAAAVFGAAVLAVSSPARAYDGAPGIVDATLGLTCVPPCTLCHASPQGGGEASKPFAANVKAALAVVTGTQMLDEQTVEQNLAAALKLIETGPCPNTSDKSCTNMVCTGECNADGTGENDILELQANQNPNNSSTLPCVEYGCGAHVAPERGSRPLDGTAALFALGTALVLARRFRR